MTKSNIKMIAVDRRDLDCILISSFRYALGRQSYITHEVSELIKRYGENLSTFFLEQIVKDIDHHIEHDLFVFDFDISAWIDLKEWCEKKLN